MSKITNKINNIKNILYYSHTLHYHTLRTTLTLNTLNLLTSQISSSKSSSKPSQPSFSQSKSRFHSNYNNTIRLFHSTNKIQKEDFYKILGVSKTATKAEIKKKYFELAKKYHPGKKRIDLLID